jgi:hypothetical protein
MDATKQPTRIGLAESGDSRLLTDAQAVSRSISWQGSESQARAKSAHFEDSEVDPCAA